MKNDFYIEEKKWGLNKTTNNFEVRESYWIFYHPRNRKNEELLHMVDTYLEAKQFIRNKTEQVQTRKG